jgi:hypothetical protein
MGPQLFPVPVLDGLASIGMDIRWMLGCQMAGYATNQLTVPITASFLMVAWDFAQDPVRGTVLNGWVWIDGAPWFGVPSSNYFAWQATVFVLFLFLLLLLLLLLFLLFALLIRRNRQAQSAMGHGVTGCPALVSIFVMGAFAVFAWTGHFRPVTD